MNRHGWVITMLAATIIGLGSVGNVAAQSTGGDDVSAAIASAEMALSEARAAIQSGREIVGQIPDDSPYVQEVAQMLKAASDNMRQAVASLKSAKESAGKVAAASSESLAKDLAILAKVNAKAATAGANVVKISLSYVEAVATNKTEALDVIRITMGDALDSCTRLQLNYEKIKAVFSEKYSN